MAVSEELSDRERKFCEEYIFDFNGSRSYKATHKNKEVKDSTARTEASKLLTKPNIRAYISELQADLGKTAGISRLKVLNEYRKMAFTSIAHLHNTWVTRKEFDQLTDDQKDSISDIQTRVIKNEHGTIEEVKIKLFDKNKALDSINKMLGYNEPDKVDLTSKGEPLKEMSTEELIKRAEALSKIG